MLVGFCPLLEKHSKQSNLSLSTFTFPISQYLRIVGTKLVLYNIKAHLQKVKLEVLLGKDSGERPYDLRLDLLLRHIGTHLNIPYAALASEVENLLPAWNL